MSFIGRFFCLECPLSEVLLTSAGGRRADEERGGEKQPKTVDDFYSPDQYSPRYTVGLTI